jgi:uncharacterized repeat protein (TIGR01451 family)
VIPFPGGKLRLPDQRRGFSGRGTRDDGGGGILVGREIFAKLGVLYPGEPASFTITKTNLAPSDLEWSVRDFLPANTEFVSATSSQGSCALASREELGIPYNPTNGHDSDVVQCDLGVIPSGGLATIDVTVTPTIPGEITNYAADTGESQASATVEVVEHH